jgi:hypothetical protein
LFDKDVKYGLDNHATNAETIMPTIISLTINLPTNSNQIAKNSNVNGLIINLNILYMFEILLINLFSIIYQIKYLFTKKYLNKIIKNMLSFLH